MKASDFAKFILLAAIWGASFLFMRVAAPAFGPIPLILIRVGGALICFLPLLFRKETRTLLIRHKGALLFVGIFISALPFSLLAFATLSIEAGFASLLNATTPLFAALIAALWFRIPLRPAQIIGLALGFLGVTILAWGRLSFHAGGSGWAIVAALIATLSYGIATNFTKHYLADVPAKVISIGSMLGATLVLLPMGWWEWPQVAPPMMAWAAALALAVICTAVAFVLYFNLLAHAGATIASSITFLIPVFGILWGAWLLHEHFTLRIACGMAVILLGTALITVKTVRSARSAGADQSATGLP